MTLVGRVSLGVAGALIVALGLAAEAATGISNDVFWLLHVADRVVDGAVLYRDVVDTNPPLSVWIYFPVVLVARAFTLSPIVVLRAAITLLSLIVLVYADRSYRMAGAPPRERRLLALGGLVATLLLPINAFGQREHIILLLMLPYATAAVRRIGRDERLTTLERSVTGLLLGIAIALKPFYASVWIGTELLIAIRRRGARSIVGPESLVVVAVGVAYLALAFTAAGDFAAVLPMLLRVYPAYAPEPVASLLWRSPYLWFAVAAVSLALAARRLDVRGPVPTMLGAATLAGLVAALLQGKALPYHFYPAAAAGLLLLLAVVAELPARARLARLLTIMALAVPVSYLLAAALRLTFGPETLEKRAYANLEAVAQPLRGHSIAALSPKTGLPMWLAAYGGGRWVLRHSCLWLPVALYGDAQRGVAGIQFNSPDRMPEAEAWFFHTTIEDLTRHRPDLLVVQLPQATPGDVRRGIDWLAYFGQDERFRDLLDDYEEAGRAEGFAILRRTAFHAR